MFRSIMFRAIFSQLLDMKRFSLITFLVFSLCFIFYFSATAQITARKATRRITAPNGATNKPAIPSPVATQATAPQSRVLTNAVPEKTKEQKEEILRKTIEFQKKRAEEGAPTAQYDLAMRYLNGDGVEKNLELAQKWLQASATNGNSQAAKRLEELKKK